MLSVRDEERRRALYNKMNSGFTQLTLDHMQLFTHTPHTKNLYLYTPFANPTINIFGTKMSNLLMSAHNVHLDGTILVGGWSSDPSGTLSTHSDSWSVVKWPLIKHLIFQMCRSITYLHWFLYNSLHTNIDVQGIRSHSFQTCCNQPLQAA